MEKFNSKIILFGEYTVLLGSSMLVIPNSNNWGYLHFISDGKTIPEELESNKVLHAYVKHLDDIITKLGVGFRLDHLKDDVEKGLFFKSIIPQNYGLGSSGALVAAIFKKYCKALSNLTLQQQLSIFAIAESFFHGKSSGMDPVCSFNNNAIYARGKSIHTIPTDTLQHAINKFQLFDTGIKASTGKLVKAFLEGNKMEEFQKPMMEYINIIDEVVHKLCLGNEESFSEYMQKISEFQFRHFKEMIPKPIMGVWQKGLNTGHYYMKLCGSGGGGYFLIYPTIGVYNLKARYNIETTSLS